MYGVRWVEEGSGPGPGCMERRPAVARCRGRPHSCRPGVGSCDARRPSRGRRAARRPHPPQDRPRRLRRGPGRPRRVTPATGLAPAEQPWPGVGAGLRAGPGLVIATRWGARRRVAQPLDRCCSGAGNRERRCVLAVSPGASRSRARGRRRARETLPRGSSVRRRARGSTTRRSRASLRFHRRPHPARAESARGEAEPRCVAREPSAPATATGRFGSGDRREFPVRRVPTSREPAIGP